MDLEKSPPQRQDPEGCLVVAIRIPVRIVVLVLVVPVRMVWDALVVVGRFLNDTLLRPLGRALLWLGKALFVWPLAALWRYVLVPLGKALAWLVHILVVVPLGWLYRWVLTPAGHAVAWLVRYLLVVPGVWFYEWVLTPVGHAVAWLVRYLLVVPVVWSYRWILTPVGRFLAVVGRELGTALGHAWRVAGYISLAVGRFLGTLFRWIFVEPVRWVYRTVLTPLGHVVRDTVLRPAAEAARGIGRATRQAIAAARESARQARADFRRMLFGAPAEPQAVPRREPAAAETRTLGSSTTALTKD